MSFQTTIRCRYRRDGKGRPCRPRGSLDLIGSPFGGTAYPINPKRKAVLSIRAYPSLSAVPDRGELAVIVTPAATIPDIVRECAMLDVAGAVIISAGFRETDRRGLELEQEALKAARQGGIRLMEPNCLGRCARSPA